MFAFGQSGFRQMFRISTKLLFFIILVCLFPIGYGFIIPHYGSFTLWMLFAVVFFFFTFVNVIYQKKFSLDKTDKIVLALLFLSPIVENYLSRDVKAAFIEMLPLFLVFFLPYYFSKYFIKTGKDLDKVFLGLTLVAILSSLTAIGEYVAQRSFYADFIPSLVMDPNDVYNNSSMVYYRAGSIRVAGSFSQPIFLGEFLLLVALFNVLLLDNDFYRFKGRLFAYFQVSLALIGSLLSQSRTAIIAFIFCVICYYMVSRKRMKYLLGGLFLVLATYIMSVTYFGDISNTIVTFSLGEEAKLGTLNYRTVIIGRVVSDFLNNINYSGELSSHFRDLIYSNKVDLINGFANKAILDGVLTAIIYLFLWLVIFTRNVRRVKRNSFNRIFFFIFSYLFIIDNVTLITYQCEVIFYILVGLQFNRFVENQGYLVAENSYRSEVSELMLQTGQRGLL